MSQAYSTPRRAADPYALPDNEVFFMDADPDLSGNPRNFSFDDDGDATPIEAGWYYWHCFPGCLPDGDAVGPFETEHDALEDALEDARENEDGQEALYLDDEDQ